MFGILFWDPGEGSYCYGVPLLDSCLRRNAPLRLTGDLQPKGHINVKEHLEALFNIPNIHSYISTHMSHVYI